MGVVGNLPSRGSKRKTKCTAVSVLGTGLGYPARNLELG